MSFSGPALIFITPDDKAVLDSYVKNYRPLAAVCDSPGCLVFPNRRPLNAVSCCTKISFSNLSKMVKKAAVQCTFERKITSRILRSQITALWKSNDDPAWRPKVATQCGHSLQTASRYYEFSEKVSPGMEVVQTLQRLAESEEEEEEDQEVDNPTGSAESGAP